MTTVAAPSLVRRAEPLGTSLIERGLLTHAELEWALGVQRGTGSRLGSILIAAGLVRRLDVYRVLSEAWHCPFVDLTVTAIDRTLLTHLDPHRLAAELWIPVHRLADGSVLIATAERPERGRAQYIADSLGLPVRLVATTDWDIRRAIGQCFAEVILDEATLGLWRRDEDHSARRVLSTVQTVVDDRPARVHCPGVRARPDRLDRDPLGGDRGGLLGLGVVQVHRLHGRVALRVRRSGVQAGHRGTERHRTPAVHDPGPGVPRGQRRRCPDAEPVAARLPGRQARDPAPARSGRRRDPRRPPSRPGRPRRSPS